MMNRQVQLQRYIKIIRIMKGPRSRRVSSNKAKFQSMIRTLRQNIEIKQKQPVSNLEQFGGDLLPITYLSNNHSSYIQDSHSNGKLSSRPQEHSFVEHNISNHEGLITFDDSKSQVNPQKQHSLHKRSNCMLPPQSKMKEPLHQGRSGQIMRQHLSVNKFTQKQEIRTGPRYSKKAQEPIAVENKKEFTVSNVHSLISIKQINDMELIKLWNRLPPITSDTPPDKISAFFERVIDELCLLVSQPMIKKYKNCIYFGERLTSANHQGILHYFDSKVYYGQLTKGIKHGHGVEIHFDRGVRYDGTFNAGQKTGHFKVRREKQTYEGQLLHGYYHGKGKLMTEESVYTGSFQNGKKHGYGQEQYPKTGFKVSGLFNNGTYSNLVKSKAAADPTADKQLDNKMQHSIVRSASHHPQFSPAQRHQVPIFNQVKMNESMSLFDMLTGRSPQHKYDISTQRTGITMPKIRIDGIQHREYYPSSEGKSVPARDRGRENSMVNRKGGEFGGSRGNRRTFSLLQSRPIQFACRGSGDTNLPLQKKSARNPLKCGH